MKSLVCYALYKKYMLCELSTKKMDECQKEFDIWFEYCEKIKIKQYIIIIMRYQMSVATKLAIVEKTLKSKQAKLKACKTN